MNHVMDRSPMSVNYFDPGNEKLGIPYNQKLFGSTFEWTPLMWNAEMSKIGFANNDLNWGSGVIRFSFNRQHNGLSLPDWLHTVTQVNRAFNNTSPSEEESSSAWIDGDISITWPSVYGEDSAKYTDMFDECYRWILNGVRRLGIPEYLKLTFVHNSDMFGPDFISRNLDFDKTLFSYIYMKTRGITASHESPVREETRKERDRDTAVYLNTLALCNPSTISQWGELLHGSNESNRKIGRSPIIEKIEKRLFETEKPNIMGIDTDEEDDTKARESVFGKSMSLLQEYMALVEFKYDSSGAYYNAHAESQIKLITQMFRRRRVENIAINQCRILISIVSLFTGSPYGSSKLPMGYLFEDCIYRGTPDKVIDDALPDFFAHISCDNNTDIFSPDDEKQNKPGFKKSTWKSEMQYLVGDLCLELVDDWTPTSTSPGCFNKDPDGAWSREQLILPGGSADFFIGGIECRHKPYWLSGSELPDMELMTGRYEQESLLTRLLVMIATSEVLFSWLLDPDEVIAMADETVFLHI